MQCDKAHGPFKLHYLKAGTSRLLFDYFVWVDVDTVFLRNPVDVLGSLGRSPLHVPLEANLSSMAEDRQWKGLLCFGLRDLLRASGIANQVYLSRSAFWVIHREAIDQVYELALGFFNHAKQSGHTVPVDLALGFAMQILCADPEAHLVAAHPELWVSDGLGELAGTELGPGAWCWRHPLETGSLMVRPAIVHVPGSRRAPPVRNGP